MTDLSTTYLGLSLRSPLVASASPHNRDLDHARRLEAAGAAAIVMPSLFEEEVIHEETSLTHALEAGSEHFAEALDYFPDLGDYPSARDRYVASVDGLKNAVDIPVIASLNATHPGSWVSYAHLLADAGADAVELNLYHVSADPLRPAAEVEESDLETVAEVAGALSVPVAVKLSPYYSSFANFGLRAVEAGAAGLVLFNRFYQPDLDLEELAPAARISLSQPWELRLPLRWIAILHPHLAGRASLAATSGIWSGADAVKALLVGADVAMMTSALLHHGADHVAAVEAELAAWLEARGYASVAEARGSVSYATTDDPGAFERANYISTLRSWTTPPDLAPSSPAS
ncbi:MAG TPA: dihydroorotate dehydrogenase-like protein [Acidimicrobiales bacterium]|nr:dihydroorotate dehydrogenase-like protein [Acidimicrobiales bacterium]